MPGLALRSKPMTHLFRLLSITALTAALVPTTAAQQRLALGGHSSPVLAVAFSPDSKTVATVARIDGDRTWVVLLWDAATGKKLRVIEGPDNAFWAVCFSPDGKRIA